MWKCPGCGAGQADETHRLNKSDAACHFVRPWVDATRHAQLADCIGDLWGKDEARLLRCRGCGLRSADPFVAGSPEFYSIAYGRESFHAYPGWRWEFRLTQALVEATTGTVLEIGAGDGAFQRRLIEAGVDPKRLYATEYSSDGRRQLKQLGVSVVDVDFRDLPSAEHSVVFAHQVFEHLDSLDAVFNAFGSLTAPNGSVALSLPNGLNKVRTEGVGGQVDAPPAHISTWQLSALEAAAKCRGWEIVDFKEEQVSRFAAAKALAISRTFQARQSEKSLAALFEKLAPTPRVRYGLSALNAASRIPSGYLASRNPRGAVIWVLMRKI
jgi:2-polyprenyl-3-methyl-5-hydroxy-6-metoxy-1,4-benzoquinol methylase